MIAKDLEAKLVEKIAQAFAAAALPKCQVFDAWQPAALADVKNKTDADTVAVVAVALAMPYSPTFSSPEVVFSGSVALTVRLDLDPSGTAFVSFAEKLETLFKSWQADTYQQAFTALDVTGLSVDEVSIGQGHPPTVVDALASVTLPFTLSGSYTT